MGLESSYTDQLDPAREAPAMTTSTTTYRAAVDIELRRETYPGQPSRIRDRLLFA